jgi:membrane protease YdiL (CAAX protease family)
MVNKNIIRFDTPSKKIALFAFLIAVDRLAYTLAYNILKQYGIPLDICTKPLPTRAWQLFHQFASVLGVIPRAITIKVQYTIQYFFPSFHEIYQRPLAKILIGPIYEEFFSRLILQEFFLRKIPKYILAEKGDLIELKSVKIFRIVLSSTIFSLLHTDLWGQGSFARAGINAQFMGGLTYGVMTECTRGISYSTLMHIFHNLLTGSAQ